MGLLPGGPAWQEPTPPAAARLLRSARQRGVPLAAICGATLALARAGILDQLRHTSNSVDYLLEQVSDYAAAALYQDEPAVTDDGVITAGGAHYVEFTVEILRLLGIYEGERLQAWYALFKHGVLPTAG